MKIIKSLMMMSFSLLISTSVFADSFPIADQKLEATGQLALRASSPDASFGTKGEKIGWIKAGEAVKVLSAKQHLTVFGLEVWVEVQSLSDDSVKGWVFDGMSAEVLKGRGKLVDLAKAEKVEVVAKLH
jgi:hypothetical protein